MVEIFNDKNRDSRIKELERFLESFKNKYYSYNPPSYKYIDKKPTAYFEVGGSRIEIIDSKKIEDIYKSLESELRSLKDYNRVKYEKEWRTW